MSVERFEYDFVWSQSVEGKHGEYVEVRSMQVTAENAAEAWDTFWKNHDTADYVSCFKGLRHVSSSEQYPNPRIAPN